MQAIIRQGGKQYLVKVDDVIHVSKIDPGKSEELSPEVLAVFDDKKIELGAPVLDKAKVSVEILGDRKSPKIHVYKYKNKTNYRRKIGHRDHQTTIKITSIKS
ncbi:50S ribosomal protein L21 [Patescibacteria group bacterium]|nr:50S ribosomal protein L21 [Patescibacteria group bacterium]